MRAVGIAVGKQQVTHRPGQQAHDQNASDGDAPQDEWHEQHHYNFGSLSQSHFSGGIGDVQRIQISIGKREIKSERNAGQDRCYREHRERRPFEHHQCVESEDPPKSHRLAFAGRRRVRKSQAEDAHHHRSSRGQQERDGGCFDSEASDGYANRDPSQCSEDTNQGKIAARIFQVLQGERVGEGDGREIAQTINEHQGVNRRQNSSPW